MLKSDVVSGKQRQIAGHEPSISGKQHQNVEPSPWWVPQGCFSGKMTSLKVLDMYFLNANDFIKCFALLASICLKAMKFVQKQWGSPKDYLGEVVLSMLQ